jgi:peptidoglycan/LPS O-acetylase OafA/YrhL
MAQPEPAAIERAGADAEARIPGLDGVRALAVLGVIASHSGLMNLGWLGVDVFFGLSGYLITGILLKAKEAAPTARQFFVPFYMRRALRILPLAWSLAIIVCAYRGELGNLGWYLSYLVNWLPKTPPPRDLGLYWSVSVEEQFYMLWPAIVFFGARRTVWKAALGLIALDITLRLGFSLWPPAFATAQWRDLASFARADALAVGALLAYRQRQGGFGREARLALPATLCAFGGVLVIRALERRQLAPLLAYNVKWPLIAFGVGAFLLFVLTQKPRPLSWPWLAWIGKISYGIYLIHGVFGAWLHQRFTLAQAPLIFLIQVGLTLPIAALSWYLFESPILRNKWRWPMPRVSGVSGRPAA